MLNIVDGDVSNFPWNVLKKIQFYWCDRRRMRVRKMNTKIQCQHLATSVFKKNCILVLVLVMDWFYDWKLLMAKDSKTCQKWKILIGNVPINQIPLSFNHFGFRSQFIKCIAKCRLSLSMAKVKSLCLSVYLIIFTLS